MSESTRQLTVGVTGPRGFIAEHLMRQLGTDAGIRVIPCPRESWSQPDALREFVAKCNTIVHLAGANRGNEREVYDTNVDLAGRLIESMTAAGKAPHVVLASSTQRERNTAYGRSKKECESRLRQWADESGARLTIVVIPHVFGPGCRPYYNSVVATFCHQLAHDQQPVVIDDQPLALVWINDLVDAICELVRARRPGVQEARVTESARLTVSELLSRLQSISEGYFETNVVPNLADPFEASLYTTFLSHVELDDHCHRPRMHSDARGQLFEIMRLAGGGQIFFSTTKPGVIRGNHFHSRKVEWFCVVRGEAVIRIRRVGDSKVREFRVSGDNPEFISVPALHTHQIENVGSDDLLTMFWCNEIFAADDPDTFQEKVA
jgi:UDP-2-acetamido-2,6-beta-L-arabino-hexul-4-ose reductase